MEFMIHLAIASLTPRKDHADDRRTSILFLPQIHSADVISANSLGVPEDGLVLPNERRIRSVKRREDVIL